VTRIPWLALCVGLLAASSASATTFSFHCLSGDGGGECAIPAEELWVDVDDLGGGEISFTLHTESSVRSSIAELYFDDAAGLLASLVAVIDGPGVDFEIGASPGNLPSGTVEGFDADWAFGAEHPKPRHGVGPGEELTVVFSLVEGTSFSDLIAAMEAGAVRVGLHAPPFGNHGNKSFVTGARVPVPTPEPGTLALLAVALAAAVVRSRRT